ncbi:ctr copper transporter family protein [Rhizodiscina lignyota]|uniref:Copper transport protein n=1 Tax=Rhizodiscina lignyota TaxID=1504668 RepID=A0A9P4ID91_9PEZI|nr:ctr copper transporter family protein [Rhizodiscina lignyota]
MDHGDMDHGGMDHGNMGHRCNMNMLFTWDTQDLCIVFRSWHVSGTGSLIGALIGVILLTAGYELVREISRRYEASTARRIETLPRRSATEVEQRSKIIKAVLYAVQVFYSFFIMLLFMTYNGWVMLAVAVGAFIGYLAFGGGSAAKTVACH